jgi:hypothetical protein
MRMLLTICDWLWNVENEQRVIDRADGAIARNRRDDEGEADEVIVQQVALQRVEQEHQPGRHIDGFAEDDGGADLEAIDGRDPLLLQKPAELVL